MDERNLENRNVLYRAGLKFIDAIYAPVIYFKETVIPFARRNREPAKYYHRRFRRVPTIDECYVDDLMCLYEAGEQYRRDKMVEDRIVNILLERYEECRQKEPVNHKNVCKGTMETYKKYKAFHTMKYAHVQIGGVIQAYMKQKNRLVYERRHPEWKQW